jgi:hypothetical protein
VEVAVHAAWVEIALSALDEAEDDVVVAALREIGAPVARCVSLFEGDLEPEEALAYARVLLELGRGDEAREVVSALLEDAEPLAAAM